MKFNAKETKMHKELFAYNHSGTNSTI